MEKSWNFTSRSLWEPCWPMQYNVGPALKQHSCLRLFLCYRRLVFVSYKGYSRGVVTVSTILCLTLGQRLGLWINIIQTHVSRT